MIDEPQPAFDPDEVCRWYEHDLDTIRELIGLVETDLPRYVETLEQAADAGDLAGVARMAHTIKGAVSNICALRLCGVTEAIEIGARSGDAARVAALRSDFRTSAMALLDAIAAWMPSLSEPARS